MAYSIPRENISAYLAGALSVVAGTPVNLCDSRGDCTDERFTLKDVPQRVDLSEVTRGIAHYHGLHESLVVPSFNNDQNYHSATLHVGGRVRVPRSTLSVTRHGHRVWVDITPLVR